MSTGNANTAAKERLQSPKLRQYRQSVEFWETMQQTEPFGWQLAEDTLFWKEFRLLYIYHQVLKLCL